MRPDWPATSGVDVDAPMRTALDGVMAIGDIAHALHPVAGRRLRVEHWGDAEGMGQVAGTVAAGGAAEWRDVPGFWSQIGEPRAEVRGLGRRLRRVRRAPLGRRRLHRLVRQGRGDGAGS